MSSSTEATVPRFGFSEIAHLFVRLKRHHRKAVTPRLGSTDALDGGEQGNNSGLGEQENEGNGDESANILSSRGNSSNRRTSSSDASRLPEADHQRHRDPSPKRIQIRHFGTHSMFHGGKSKAHHLFSSSGEEPITHAGLKEGAIPGVPAIPVEYTDRFDCEGGVNAVTLIRVTRNTLLETVEEFLGANALVDELSVCISCNAIQIVLMLV